MRTTVPLLPDARIDVFAHDPSSHNTIRHLTQDWRMARIKLRADQGDIVSAVNRYQTEQSPDIVIIETHVIDASFTQYLEALANVCSAGTAAIFIGPQNDINLYRHLLDMGATDYLVRPISGDDLLQVIYKALQHKIGTSNSRFITVMGSKGGVGTSRMTQALAQTIATHEEKITLLDSGGSWGATGSSFGFEPLIALRDLAGIARTQEATLDDLRHNVTPYLSWIAAGGDPLLISTLVIDGFEILIDALLRRCPNLIIDLSQSATGIRALAFAKAHHIVLVTNATPIALRNTRLLIKEIQNMRGSDAPIHLIVNQHGALSKDEISIRDIATTLHVQPSAIVAHQPDLFSQIDTVEGNEFLQAMDKIVPSLQDLAHKITGRRGVANTMPQDRTLIQRFLQRG